MQLATLSIFSYYHWLRSKTHVQIKYTYLAGTRKAQEEAKCFKYLCIFSYHPIGPGTPSLGKTVNYKIVTVPGAHFSNVPVTFRVPRQIWKPKPVE